MCAGQWAAGEIVPGIHRVPDRLAACAVTSLGVIGVFPDTTCAALRLPEVPAGYGSAAQRFFALARALEAGLVGSGSTPRCVSEPAAASYVRQTARKHGFASWRIILPAVAEPQLCWQAQADPAAHTISVVPQPGVYAPGNGPARVIRQVMDPLYSATRCRVGSKPESTAGVSRELRARLRTAGYGNWTVTVVGLPDSRSAPCYVTGGFSGNQPVIDINSVGISG
jgi:hypothetical protein